jgi:hypothetical protein
LLTINTKLIVRAGDVMIYLLTERATPQQLSDMLEMYPTMIKIVVDIRRRILTTGGEMHSDCGPVLLDIGSQQDDLWGAHWYPTEKRVEFESSNQYAPPAGQS